MSQWMQIRRVLRLALMLAVVGVIISLAAIGCGGSETTLAPLTSADTPTPEGQSADEPPQGDDVPGAQVEQPEPGSVSDKDTGPLLSPNGVALFGRISAGSTSDLLRIIDQSGQVRDIRLESESYALMMIPVLPELGDVIVFDTYTSPSYAKSTKSPSTVDDQLFIIRRWDNGETDVTEYDPQTLKPFLSTDATHFFHAVIGDTAYYYRYPEYDNFTGWSGQLEFIQEPLNGGQASRTTLRNVQSYLNDPYFPFALISTGQNLYGLKSPSSSDPSIVILRVDQATGEPTEMVTFTVNGFDDYAQNSWLWVVDNGFVYWAAMRQDSSDTIVEIWWHELERPSQPQSVSLTLPQGATRILDFDIDEGLLVLNPFWEEEISRESKFILFDLSTQTTNVIDLGVRVRDVQIIKLGE